MRFCEERNTHVLEKLQRHTDKKEKKVFLIYKEIRMEQLQKHAVYD
jgi:hypothetical protein